MPSAEDTKLKILKGAECIILEKGFNGVGLAEILAAVNVPRGSFYYYFPSKEAFGVQLLSHYMEAHLAYLQKELIDATDLDPMGRLMHLLDGMIEKTERHCTQCPCLIVKLSGEVATTSEGMRQVLAEGAEQGAAIYIQLIREGQDTGIFKPEIDAETTGAVIHDLVNGMLQRCHTVRNTEPLKHAKSFLLQTLPIEQTSAA